MSNLFGHWIEEKPPHREKFTKISQAHNLHLSQKAIEEEVSSMKAKYAALQGEFALHFTYWWPH